MKTVLEDKGSVMLETILVLPVYFILIAVTFYVGEISLYRNLLLELDGYDMQRQGSRNVNSETDRRADAVKFLFQIKDETDRKWSGFRYEGMEEQPREVSSNEWWQATRVLNKGFLTLPSWIKGIFYLSGLHDPQTRQGKGREKFIFYGSSVQMQNGNAVSSLPFFSRKDENQWRGGDHKEGEKLCADDIPAWTVIAGENYCGSAGPVCRGGKLEEYSRSGFDKNGNGISAYRIFSGE